MTACYLQSRGKFMKTFSVLFLILLINITQAQELSLNNWSYIAIDTSRQKWGDFDEPDWLRYFGLDFWDVNHDDLNDIVSGRYVYLNPGGEMLGPWERIDLGFNVDAMIAADVDGDVNADVIAQALPDVFWLEANDSQGRSWKARRITRLPKTGHTNGQGYRLADVFKGGKPEILMTAEGGIYAIRIPDNSDYSSWKARHIVKSNSDEGFDCADVDGDGDLDVVAGRSDTDGEHADILSWYENPGNDYQEWIEHKIGNTVNAIDRVRIADLNGDGLPDVGVAEEQFPPEGPTAYLFWFEQKESAERATWERHTVVEQWSLHNLDAGDVDRDGDVDLVTCEHKGEDLKLQVWKNDGKGTFSEVLIDQGKESHLGTQLCDLDQDGDLDIVSIAWDNFKFVHLWRNDAIRFYSDGNPDILQKEFNQQRRMDVWLDNGIAVKPGEIRINSCFYNGTEHFKITTLSAVYFLEKSSGGFSSIIDKSGNDWVDHSKSSEAYFPASAAADYRGIPNMLYGDVTDSGAGHPGFNVCRFARQINDSTIQFVSQSKSFVWSWIFHDHYARLHIEKVGRDQPYWVLYEGPVAGRYHPFSKYWGTDSGIRTEIPDFLNGETLQENWQWVYFGDKNVNRVFFIAQKEADEKPDVMGFMGASDEGLRAKDGMVVFGFGRNLETQPLFNEPHTFYFGFFDKKVIDPATYAKFNSYINSLIKR